jgi:integrase
MAKNYTHRHIFTYKGKKYDIKGNSEAEVLNKWASRLAKLEQGADIGSSSVKVRDYAMHIYETYRKPKVKKITYDRYIGRLNRTILDKIGDMKLQDVKRIHCQMCLNDLEGYSKYQIGQCVQMLNFIFDQAIIDDLIVKSPAKGIIPPNGTKEDRRSLTAEEEEIFLKVAKSEPRFNIFLLSYYCGCRPEEARHITGADIFVEDGYPLLHIRGTKTAYADRIVPLDVSFYDSIKRTKRADLVAPNMAGNPHNGNTYYRAWQNLCRQMNIEMGCETYRSKLIPPFPLAEDLTPYCLRHTYGTNLLKAGLNIKMVQTLMGHNDISTTNIYLHINKDDILDAAKFLQMET